LRRGSVPEATVAIFYSLTNDWISSEAAWKAAAISSSPKITDADQASRKVCHTSIVSDGAEGAEYMQEFRSLVENPMRLMV
jgi:hypothetical protein